MKLINTSSRYQAIGPYSQAVRIGDTVYCSGIIGLNAEGVLAEGVENQVGEVFENIRSILAQENLNLTNVVKTVVFLTDMNNFAILNERYSLEFGTHRPARSTVQVVALPRGAQVEIEVIASDSSNI